MIGEREVVIAIDHPSLPGHFPGHPVVPGVVLLAEVLDSLKRLLSRPAVVTGLPSVKFHRPLRPGETVVIEIEEESRGLVSFRCRVAATLVASGVLEVATRSIETGRL